ncbi:MAG: hypothetical protein RL557_177 [archaeon]|jgi:flagellin-like protein
MSYKKAQSGIITTILIILLVLAAIVIVWQVVNSTIRGGSEQIEKQSGCLGINMEIVSADAKDNKVKITRMAGGSSNPVTVKLLVDGAIVSVTETTQTLSQLESKIYTITGTPDPLTAANQNVEVAPILADGTSCNAVATVKSINSP